MSGASTPSGRRRGGAAALVPPAGRRAGRHQAATPSSSAEFVYDPADPTPSLGGPRLMAKIAGRRDNREHEARPDVLRSPPAPLTEPVEAIGPVTRDLARARRRGRTSTCSCGCATSTAEGRSWNVCDGLTRVSTVDDGEEVRSRLWPTAYRFARRAPDPGAGQRGRAPAVRPQPGHRRRARRAERTGAGAPGSPVPVVDRAVHRK